MTQGKAIPEKTWKEFLEIYADNAATIMVSCKALSISTKSYYRKLYDDKVFKDTIERIDDCIHTPLIESVVKRHAIQGDGPSQRFYLSRRGGERWNSKLQADKFYHEQVQKSKEEQGIPDDPFTLFSYELYKPLRRRAIGQTDPEWFNKQAKKMLGEVMAYSAEKEKKRSIKKTKKIRKNIGKKGTN